jgi:ubiquinone biosynthesis protein UbiJ
MRRFRLARSRSPAMPSTAARNSASSLVRDGADYLVEESRDLIAKPEMEQFLDEVDELRERSDRLEARMRRLDQAQRT